VPNDVALRSDTVGSKQSLINEFVTVSPLLSALTVTTHRSATTKWAKPALGPFLLTNSSIAGSFRK
jgi:hypothetical protein